MKDVLKGLAAKLLTGAAFRALLKKFLVLGVGALLALLATKFGVTVPAADQVDHFVTVLVGLLAGGIAHFFAVDVPKALSPKDEAQQKIADLEAALKELRGGK